MLSWAGSHCFFFFFFRLEENFQDANEFRPERFDSPEVDGAMYAYLPFLIGPRMCLGYKFALVEMKITLAVLLRKLHFDTIPGVTYKRKNRVTMRPDPSLRLRVSVIE